MDSLINNIANPINIGIIGAAGYTGGELIRILINHPNVKIAFAHSKSQAGKPVYATHTDLLGDTELVFTVNDIQTLLNETDLHAIFLCSGHGESKKFLSEFSVPDAVKIIDLSTDFRNESEGFIYGLPELQREKIKSATKIANPGCFATSIELAILPLASAGLIQDEIHVSAVTGSTGAGQALSPTTHFTWRNNNVSIYKAFTHQHLTEINMSVGKLQNGFDQAINFIPYRGDYTRGIMANVYTTFSGTIEEAKSLYKDYYASHPFTHVSDMPVDLKQVVNTNKCLISLEVHDGKLLITSIIDNLTKGASGQAVQNLNLLFGLSEDAGLRLKAPAF
ncbi:N-acetyl-gamma-glutamyl-phosphate reductase [Dyadobacter sediminis]|uniref:N-acetyl-gamma-glutamyl-phosphate reductase n=1 Tax=Dyadobacter sediminis TaxID=1493691 RepID=A0A5R9K8Y3_9BACT|nr:N-acetyl-gamma-glutamyl-phosphate reductase [Dyadobacter sediminis]TLU90498.1 N-acetyl-gamma-glutamyl-phosphate reductase [Dyadobacter sediminis]GGC08198.1 N-acetyl-gamma-glutamyl-phosphate reductase [Dyadobacter sediminis]